VENYFNYFTEIEEHFLRRRGGGFAALNPRLGAHRNLERCGAFPLRPHCAAIEAAFDRYNQRPSKTKKVTA